MVLSTTASTPAENAAPPFGRGKTTALIQRRLMPILIGAYGVSFLDRTSIGLARGGCKPITVCRTPPSAWVQACSSSPTRSRLSIAAVGSPVMALLGFCLSTSLFFVVQAIRFTYPASRLSGVQLATGLAFVNSCGLLEGFVGATATGVI